MAKKFGLEFAALSEDRPAGTPDAVPIDSLVLIENEKAYTHSTAALRIARHLDGIWSAAYVFIFMPKVFRDFFYKLFARHRYRLFGKKDVCMMPTPELKQRFLS